MDYTDGMNEAFNIADLFFEAVKKNPGKTAIIFKNKKISFSELQTQVEDTCQYFLSKGIAKGDRVFVFVPMSINLYRIVLALFTIGATAVFLDEWVNKKRMEQCCRIAQSKAFIGVFKARALARYSNELRKVPVKLGTGYKRAPTKTGFDRTTGNDTALITFTTGTTGTPKAALRTHGFLYHQFNALEQKLAPANNDVCMAVLPIVLLINLGTGTTSVIADFKGSRPGLLKPAKLVRQIKRQSVNCIIASPFFVKKIAEYLIKKKITLAAMKKLFTGGAPVFAAEANIYKQAFPGTQTEVVYGSTEAEPISAINIEELIRQKDTLTCGLNVGKVAPCAKVKIIKINDKRLEINTNDELGAITLQTGETGEITVSGNHVLRQYLNNKEALNRNKIFIGGDCWHRTGDSGYLDERNNLFLTGRCSTLIYADGTIIYPFIYEKYFSTVDGVEAGTIIMLNGKVSAVIEMKEKSKKGEIEKAIKNMGGSIAQIIFIKKIPRDPRHNSKIDYEKLKSVLRFSN